MSGGILSSPFIQVATGAELSLNGGTVVNSGALIVERGLVKVRGIQNFAKLQVLDSDVPFCQALLQTSALIFNSLDAPSTIRFQDSRDIAWSGLLQIRNYNTTNASGSDRLFVGMDAQGLTGAQLSRIVFVNPHGLAPGTYNAGITADGEIVPVPSPKLEFTTFNGQFVLSWQGNQELTTATNVLGPYETLQGVSSPFTNLMDESRRFFKLKEP
jgi:hypothetical protein